MKTFNQKSGPTLFYEKKLDHSIQNYDATSDLEKVRKVSNLQMAENQK